MCKGNDGRQQVVLRRRLVAELVSFPGVGWKVCSRRAFFGWCGQHGLCLGGEHRLGLPVALKRFA